MTWLKSVGWVALCALISIGLGWWLGQGAQDWMAPEVSRPTTLGPEALHVFLTQLPWQAHAARLSGHALGLAVATVPLHGATVPLCPHGGMRPASQSCAPVAAAVQGE